MRKTYFSKAYKETVSAGNKAKTDIENILTENGYTNIGNLHKVTTNVVYSYFYTLQSVLQTIANLRKGDVLVVQYPLKKYYEFICKCAHFKGVKVVTLIHDLGSFRRKKLTIEKEISRLECSDYIIVHNQSMKKWLEKHHIKRPVSCLQIFDYLSKSTAKDNNVNDRYRVIYAGALSRRKNAFLYDMAHLINNYKFHIYGGGFDSEEAKKNDNFIYCGYKRSEDFIAEANGEFGLVWDGDSVKTCSGSFGEYLKYNNPHKVSFYIRCNLPIIIWEQAGLAPFIEKEGIGITINSLAELDEKIGGISDDEYRIMLDNIKKASKNLATGYYTKQAVNNAFEHLTAE